MEFNTFFLEKYVHLKKNDNVVIFYTPDSRDIAGAVKFALTQLEISCEVCWMKPIKDDFFFLIEQEKPCQYYQMEEVG